MFFIHCYSVWFTLHVFHSQVVLSCMMLKKLFFHFIGEIKSLYPLFPISHTWVLIMIIDMD